METILKIASKHNLFVIEDTAQAIGADNTFSDGTRKQAGTMGTIGCTSFFSSKNLGCYGDCGALFTNDANLAKYIKMITNHSQEKKYHHDTIGVNSRLNTLKAAILDVKRKYLNQYSTARSTAAGVYDELLRDISEIQIPTRNPQSSHGFHHYMLKIHNGKRDELKTYLHSKGIPTMIYYPIPMHLQKAYAAETFPAAEDLTTCLLSLPMHTDLKIETQEFIVNTINLFYA
jgi:dTDP-4-amino-4,6-dideoxygalactose transaminase